MGDRKQPEQNLGSDDPGFVVLDGISKSYPGAASPALQTVSLTIGQGEFFSILGPSGSGKTTTLRLIAGFEQPDHGNIILAGKVVTDLPPNKRDVNTVFQNYALFPHLTVAQNVAYPLIMRKLGRDEIRASVAEALTLVEMAGFDVRLPHQLSGGQRQRIALARALIGQPKVLLLDEPLGALDLRLRQQMQHVLTSLQERLGITFVYVTHDQGEALSMSNRVAVMSHGRIEQVGTPEDLYYAPKNAFVANFVGKSNLIDAEVVASGGGFAVSIGGHSFALNQATRAGRAKLALRCECLSLAKRDTLGGDAPGGDVALPAIVKDVLFIGTSLEILLDCGGRELIAVVPAQRERRIASGDAVQCRFDTADIRVLYD
jgi:spermidine/putrescine transport system ATP-binding protein